MSTKQNAIDIFRAALSDYGAEEAFDIAQEYAPRRIPDKTHEISGREILENGNASFYTSTRERANLVAAEIYVEWAQRRVEAARHEVLLFEHYYELGYSRLNEYRANSYYEQACSRLNQH